MNEDQVPFSSVEESIGQNQVTIDMASASLARIEAALTGPLPASVNKEISASGIISGLRRQTASVNMLLQRINMLEQAIVSGGPKAARSL